ncbi:hypothetical protein EV363DRAFT_1430070 [Boletus edulis]|nr:hypothetical protein EV363DRAFT_1430070 [Boletus edulis]
MNLPYHRFHLYDIMFLDFVVHDVRRNQESKCQTSCTARSSLRSSSLSFSLSSTHTRLSVVPFPPAMASPDVVAAALLLPIPLLSLALSLYNYFVHRSTPIKAAALLFLAILAAPLRVVAKVFTNLLHAACKQCCSISP